jgi:hypothetical protein
MCRVVALFLALLLVIIFSLFPGRIAASSIANTGAPSLEVHAGFGSFFRNGAWVPLYITLHNIGKDFSGTVAASNAASPIWQDTFTMIPASTYQQPVTLSHGEQKQYTLYLPMTSYSGKESITVQLLNSQEKVVQSQNVLLQQLFPWDVLVGLLSSQSTGFASLEAVTLPNQNGSVQAQYLNAQTMPSMAATLANFNLIVLDRFSGSFTRAQLRALNLWVQQGGTLIEIGGLHWQQNLSTVPTDLLPVNVSGTSVLPAGTHLLPGGIPNSTGSGSAISDTLQSPITVSDATVREGARTIMSAGAVPLIVESVSGRGFIDYLAYDPSVEPLVEWPGATVLWRELIIRSLGDQVLAVSYSASLSTGIPFYLAKLQHLLIANSTPVPWLPLIFFFSYLAMLGPVRWFIVRKTRRRLLSWRIVLSTILIFSLLSYAVAFYQGRASIFSNSLSVIQLAQGSSFAHSSSYSGVYIPFVPANSNVKVHVPGDMQVQSFVDTTQLKEQVTITAATGGTQVMASDSAIRSLDAFMDEQDISIKGGIISHLVLGNGGLAGTVTNTLNTTLSDVYLLLSHSIVRIGNLAPGQTSHVVLSLAVPSSNGSLPSCGSLVKQVVANNPGILTSYDHLFTHSVSQSVSESQRHLNLLVFMLTASQCSNPLLGATSSSATLIGWADQPLDGADSVTINGVDPGGIHETMLLTDLAYSYSAGSLTLPPDVLPGQLVDAEGLGVRLLSPDSYAMSRGQMTFEFSMPAPAHFQIQSMTFSQPADASIPSYIQQAGSNAHTSHVALYNWQTNSWDIIHLTQSASFTTQNAKAYLNADGRILIQYVNQSADFSDVAFTRPLLTITGVG